MSISSNKYVNITSGVGGAAATSARELMLRLITTNELVPTGSILQFSDTDSVLNYFGGSTAPEYLQALYYFSFVSKTTQKPKNIQFARWADVANSAQVFGAKAGTLTALQAYTTGAFGITLAGVTLNLTGLDFSAATSYADVATELQTEIQLLGAPLATTTVTFDATRGGFNFDTNGTADGAISFAEVTAGLLTSLGWDATAIYSDGVAVQTPVEVMSSGVTKNNNFGSFAFIDDLIFDQIDTVAAWNNSQNVLFQYMQKATKSESLTWYDDLKGYSGLCLVGYDATITDQYPWLLPCALLASINWDNPAASTNFMFTQDDTLTPLITDTAESDQYDAVRLNYMGNTQNAGAKLQFYQRGVLMGGNTAPLQQGVYAGEQWFKSENTAQFLNMFLALPNVAADTSGKAIVLSYLDASIKKALFNGVISVGKELTTTQIAYITQVTGSDSAYRDIQNIGYWRTAGFTNSVGSNGVTEYTATYTVLYAKADSVNKVEGTDTLI